jgi:hypothetical protein
VAIWKLSHGYKEISQEQSDWLDEHNYLTIHENTKKSQGQFFIEHVNIGDIISLSRSGDLKALVKVTSDVLSVEGAPFNDGWVFRKYKVIQELPSLIAYVGKKKGWTPIYNGTLYEVPKNEWSEFEASILVKFYNLTLQSLGVNGIQSVENVQYQYIEKCKASPAFDKFLAKQGLNKAILNDAIRVVHEASPSFDLYNTNKVSSSLRFGCKKTTDNSGKVAGEFRYDKGLLNLFFSKRYGRKEPKRLTLSDDVQANEQLIIENIQQQLNIFNENGLCGKNHWPIDYDKVETITEAEFEDDSPNSDIYPLNQILYGPPGTGKTYNTIVMAVNAAEPNFFPDGESKDELRAAFKVRYDQLVAEGRVRFVTFHQSYGYEEFVEGLSAKTEGDQLSYFEKDGVFKSICDDAKLFRVAKTGQISDSFDARWQVFSDCLAEAETGVQIETLSKKTFFTITDVTNNTIRFDKSKGNSVHTLSVKTLKAVYNQEKEIKGGLQPYYGALIEHLSHIHVPQAENQIERKHFVLVIDEINRGNISKVFGELITLIEPSKRLGKKESLEVILPCSGDKFSVPDNLYIIGTMNTADRSLALMDTALRRRFDFVEMMPDYSVLKDDENLPYCINNLENEIDLVQLLSTVNKRISALYDREHTLGHAFLMPVVDKIKLNDHQGALTELANCFQNKLIPLLAEYFFEDWQKIRLVLADNQKPKELQLIKETDVDLADLFGDTDEVDVMDDELNDYQLIKADSELWLEPLTYLGIYQPSAIGK